MKKNYLHIVARGVVDSDYFIDLKDLNEGKKDLEHALIWLVRKDQKIEKIDFCETTPGAW